ncbi:sulfatase-like hydrolase/transferase [Zobellia galactanivorans]|uniref:sulfatase-like hydrolase/transferase n=1 Tax=Zobellia galactanivorans (strain DSM 12802 / CCUG 47099 / CIP 106680 / NCIMB 13871 / Dsij) TaxID=63186 RepID=UPI0026E3C6E3|nr:sulfatase-like hydrolase/transferase [Zobellia galactanivorans]MDO6807383.1 sulfatase-like hydrolase/transferase [Zobellia galactanivorans]
MSIQKFSVQLLSVLVFTATLLSCAEKKQQEKADQTAGPKKKPNIIYILTDDLGYGDIGVFFQNQRQKENDRSEPWALTPQLDKMASEGAMLTHHYTAAPVCAPSRSSLLLGVSQGHANVRNGQFDKALADNHTLGNLMQRAGYTTAAIGKWGLQGSSRWSENGDSWPAHPNNRGFDYYYGYMRHRDGHEHYPVEGIYRGKKEVYENKNEVSEGLDKCYTGDLWTAVAKKWIVEQVKEKDAQEPFFMYLAFDTPHAVLELPTQAYPEGGGLNGGLQWIGQAENMINTASGEVDSYIHPDYAHATYDHDKNPETPEVAWPDVYKRYATSTRRIDNEVGDLLQLLKDLNIDENTLVIFNSDNGPSIESYLPEEEYAADFFNSFGPFNGIKRDVLEGGERTPLIARWPNKIPAGQVIDAPSISYDWLPTFTEAAGYTPPANTDGVSLLPILTGTGKQQESLIYVEYNQGGKTPEYEEFAPNNRGRRRKQMQMMRMGDIVGLRYDIQSADDDFELYDVTKDSHQTENLAGKPDMTALQSRMKERALQVRMPDTAAARPYDPAMVSPLPVPKVSKGLKWAAFEDSAPWLPKVDGLSPIANGTSQTPTLENIVGKGEVFLFEGFIKIPTDGNYTFSLAASGKAFVRIHEASVIDADYGYEAGTLKEGSMNLKAGYHPIRIYYKKKTGTKPTLDIQWSGPTIEKGPIPESVFYSNN